MRSDYFWMLEGLFERTVELVSIFVVSVVVNRYSGDVGVLVEDRHLIFSNKNIFE